MARFANDCTFYEWVKMKRHEVLINVLLEVRDNNSNVYGLGTLISKNYVLTCAHVVKAALQGSVDAGESYLKKKIILRSLKQRREFTAIVVFYNAQIDGRLSDIAILKMAHKKNISKVEIIPFVDSRNLTEHKVYSYGKPQSKPAGVWARGIITGRQTTGYYQLDSDKTIVSHFDRGFSGAAVWDEKEKGIVGIISQASRRGSALMIPTSYILKKYPKLPLKRAAISKYWKIIRYIVIGVALTAAGLYVSKPIQNIAANDVEAELAIEEPEPQEPKPIAESNGQTSNVSSPKELEVEPLTQAQKQTDEASKLNKQTNAIAESVAEPEQKLEVATEPIDVTNNIDPVATDEITPIQPQKPVMPSQKIKYLTITLLKVRIVSGNMARVVLQFKNTVSDKGLAVTLFDPRANGIADYWKFFPQSDMILVDNVGNEYSLRDSTLGIGVVEEDWLVMYPDEESIVSFEFHKSSSGSIGSSFDLSGTLQMSWRDHNNEVQFGQYGVYLANITP